MKILKLKIIYKNTPIEIEYFIRKWNNETLLYLHGGACSKDDFIDACNIYELKKYSLVSFDYPWCGNSTHFKDISFDIDDLVEITQIIILKLNLKNIHLIVHSASWLISLLYILKYKNNVKSLISIEWNMHIDNCQFSKEIIKQSYEEFEKSGLSTLIKKLRLSDNKGYNTWASTIENTSSGKALYDICWSIIKYSKDKELMNGYCKLKIPKMYIYWETSKDRFPFLDYLKSNGYSKVSEVSKSDHFPFYDNPKEFYLVLSKFIKNL